MRRISTNVLKPGMQLSLPLRDENSKILLNRNVELTERYIERLKNLGCQTVYISDPDLLDVDYDEMISDQVRYESVKRLNKTHSDVYDALSSDRPYRKSLPHDQVVDIIKDSAYVHLNAEIVKEFLNIVPRYPAGTNLEVVSGKNVGFTRVVISMNELSLNNPNIRLLFDAKGNRIEQININLEKQIGTKIKLIND